VESILGPLGTAATTGLLHLARVIVRMEKLVEWMDLAGETEVLGENLYRRHFVRHKSYLRARTQAAAVGSQRLTAWDMTRPRVKNFLFSKSSRPALRSTHPPTQWVPGALSPGVKRPGREVGHSHPTSAEVKKMWIYTSTPHTPSWRSASTGITLPLTESGSE
jgi:hypothetical protein